MPEKQYTVEISYRMKGLKIHRIVKNFHPKVPPQEPVIILPPLSYPTSFPSLIPAYLAIPESAIFIRKTNCIHIILPARYAKSFPIENLPFTN